MPFATRIRTIALTIVVLPTPGPPVMTRTLDTRASRIAVIWLSARTSPMRFSVHGRALSSRSAAKAMCRLPAATAAQR